MTTNWEKLIEVTTEIFGFPVIRKEKFGPEVNINCDVCPMQSECDEYDVCLVEDWWDKPFQEGKNENIIA